MKLRTPDIAALLPEDIILQRRTANLFVFKCGDTVAELAVRDVADLTPEQFQYRYLDPMITHLRLVQHRPKVDPAAIVRDRS